MKKYRIVPYDIVNDMWIIQEHIFWFLWKAVGMGNKEKLQKIIKEASEEKENV